MRRSDGAQGEAGGRRRRIAVAAVVVLALVGGGLWWWGEPSKSENVPASACWGLVTAGDLRTLTDGTGEAGEVAPITPTDLSGRAAKAACTIDRRPSKSGALVEILVSQLDEAAYRAARDHETERAGTGKNAVLDFGAGIDGWRREAFDLYLLLRCDNGRPAEPGAVYREIYLSSAEFTLSVDPPARERTQIFADIAHRTAAEIVRQEGCPGVQVAERPPLVAG
ncbi:hypothetical protein ACFCX4_00410 [Kitasatospora sp. NPDC056327]|uniref:hypothetical protein n=1 Tax=Kitasatospora sp. NPDC056327 TaxID=3345785 RepID=UPI0035DD5D83